MSFSDDRVRIKAENHLAAMIIAPECRIYTKEENEAGLMDEIYELNDSQ